MLKFFFIEDGLHGHALILALVIAPNSPSSSVMKNMLGSRQKTKAPKRKEER